MVRVSSSVSVLLQVQPEDAGSRLDLFLQSKLPDYSRSRLQDWIKRGRVLVDGQVRKASFTLRGNESLQVEPTGPPPLRAFAEDIPVEIIHVDEDVIAVNKPAGMVVHAGAGRHSGTLVNAILHRFHSLSSLAGEERPGIVHRLDRHTSGVLLIARTDAAHRHLAAQFASREVEKIYLAVVQGIVQKQSGRLDARIIRDPVRRTRMTAKLGAGRTALTQYEVLERFPKHTYLRVGIGTGRTHQIRVHFAGAGHPVAGDTLYGAANAGRGRFFLHANRIAFTSPSRQERITLEAPLPEELADWLDELRRGK
jgi:23S rRNA pseudouridine1911/1915/1917 synthase